jgi:hypothetical protein
MRRIHARIPVAIPTAGIRAASITERKALERKRIGNHYNAYEFEYQPLQMRVARMSAGGP